MNFIARIRHHSLVWKSWHQHAKVSGVLGDVLFRWEPSHVYRSGILTQDQIEAFRLHPDVELEMTDISLPEMGETQITEQAVEVESPPHIEPPAAPKPKLQLSEAFMKRHNLPPRK